MVVLNTYDWFDDSAEYKRPALCLMNKEGSYESLRQKSGVAVNRKYELTSRKFISEKLPNSIDSVSAYSGDTELTVSEGINDCCVEIVYGGRTRIDNGLKVIEVVRFSDISLIGEKQFANPWEKEYMRIMDRVMNPTDSYTSQLLEDQNEIVKKFGQESAEFIQAYAQGDGMVNEALDVIYSVMVALASKGTAWEEVENELQGRGNNEKGKDT